MGLITILKGKGMSLKMHINDIFCLIFSSNNHDNKILYEFIHIFRFF